MPPPLIVNVVDGVSRDVSRAPRYRAVFLKDMEKIRPYCAAGEWGACAGFAAAAARAGVFEQAWQFVLAHYSREPDWGETLPEDCRVPAPHEFACPADQRIVFDSYPDALAWFLRKHGYIETLP